MSDFERPMPTYRLATTHYGDDLQAVAARELGDANRWVELIWLNRLAPPYITSDPARVSATVLLAGALIKIPAPVGVWTEESDTGQVFERDCAMVRRQLREDDAGDLMVFAGVDNLKQQLLHRVVTPKGQAVRHPEYGCSVYRLLGRVNGPTAGLLGAQYVRAAVASDHRVQEVQSARAAVSGEAIAIDVRAVAISGASVDISVS